VEASKLVDDFVRQAGKAEAPWRGLKIQDHQAGKAIAALSAPEQVQVVLKAVERQVKRTRSRGEALQEVCYLKALADNLLRRKLPFQSEELAQLLGQVTTVDGSWTGLLSVMSILRAVNEFIADNGLPDALRSRLTGLLQAVKSWPSDADNRKTQIRLAALLEDSPGEQSGRSRFTSGEPWTHVLHEALGGLDQNDASQWDALLVHCSTANSSKPSGKWLKEAEKLVGAIGPDRFSALVRATLAEIGKPGPTPKKFMSGYQFDLDPTMVHDTHSDLLRGLIWCTSLVPRNDLIAAVGDAAEICFKKIPGIGPRAPKIGNACLTALSSGSEPAAVAQLSRLKTKTKHTSIRKQLDKALDHAAAHAGMTTEELEETAVPTCGLTEVGGLHRPFGEFTGLLEMNEHGHLELAWLRGDKKQRTTPAAVQAMHAVELRSLQALAKEANKVLTAQRHRLEQLFWTERTWSYADFRTGYVDHPLVGILAQRLIWRVGTDTAIWHNGQIVDELGRALRGVSDDARVSLWHPLSAAVESVQAWRIWLEEHAIRQPFKQAHREIYLLTPAERQTGTYSNRFAAHILRQHQFLALCQERGWRYQLQGGWDSGNTTPTLALPHCGLRAEFWVNGVPEEGSGATGFAHLATDQVRFYQQDEAEPLPLDQVPPLVFSEGMRDVDLFVGVTSVGNDPTWADSGPDWRFGAYWHNYSFGDLSATAQTRKEVLERLIPRLRIANRCSFTDRSLVVRGDWHTYKIHLGSGNILMSPNDQYLCIVPKRTAGEGRDRVFLPFEGDTMLSIILSKALLLAGDARIKDPSILHQIRPRGG
jgi:hypothetical protein